jgi:hypothetical protein
VYVHVSMCMCVFVCVMYIHVPMIPAQKVETSNHCKLLMVLLLDGMFNKHIGETNIFGDKPDLASLCRPQVPYALA